MRPSPVDVAVVGAGPAGATIATMLASRGLKVAMLQIDAPARRRRSEVMSPRCVHAVGEWLPKGILDDSAVARRCSGIQSRWSGPDVHYDSYGDEAAFLIDRAALDQALLNAAREAGVRLESGCRVDEVTLASAHATLAGTRAGAAWSLDARFAVDATGRSCRVARRLGVTRHHLARQVAMIGCARVDYPPCGGNWFRVERARHGWWSAAPLPGVGWELVYYRTVASPKPDRSAIAQWFRSTRLALDVGEWDTTGASQARGFDAGFSALETVQGHRWIAVGDAAVAFDPISSQGLWHAIGSASAAAAAVENYLARGNSRGLASYEFRTFATLRHHARELRRHYEGML